MFCYEWLDLLSNTTESTANFATTVPLFYYTPENLKVLNRKFTNGGKSNEDREQNAD